MKRRSKAQWQSLIQKFEHSGLTQTQFCAQQGLNANYFSSHRTRLKTDAADSPFSEAVPSRYRTDGSASIQYGNISIQLPATSAQQIADLVKALAQ